MKTTLHSSTSNKAVLLAPGFARREANGTTNLLEKILMRRITLSLALADLVGLALASLFAVDLFADKPKEAPPDAHGAPQEKALAQASRSESASKLPVARVVLFNSGVGYFQREGDVEGDTHIDLSFPVQDVNDLLKSLVVQDLGGGQVSAVSLDSQAPIEKTLKSFAIDLSSNPSLAQILDQARGEKVEVVLQQSATSQPGTVTGAIVGVEKQKQPVGKDGVVEVEQLNLWCAEGIRQVKLADVQRVRFLNPILDSEFRKALEVVTLGHDTQKKAVSFNFSGQGKRSVRVGYVVENPIWKTSYRLVLNKESKPFLQGWAVVENTTDEDWNGVRHGAGERPAGLVQDGPVSAACTCRGRPWSPSCSPRYGRRVTVERWKKCPHPWMHPLPRRSEPLRWATVPGVVA